MRPVVTVAEMREADASAPVAVDVLIARAGRAVANEALRMLGGGYGRRVVIVAGKGNNGADGREAAAVLAARGASVEVVPPGAGVGAADLVIDAAFGTGFRGAYKAPDPGGAPVLAVDIPSGVDGDTGAASEGAVAASATVTMAALKPGLLFGEGAGRAGRLTVADIGLPVRANASLVGPEDLGWIPRRPRDTHKWATAVWIVAGSPGMAGAARLCARAAQRAGAGMVQVGSPGLHASDHPPTEAVAVSLPSTGWQGVVLEAQARVRAIVAGPGLGRGAASASIRALVSGATVPTVIDADGLNALGSEAATTIRARRDPATLVLTPHDREFERLAGAPPGADRMAAARSLAASTGAVILLKGPTTVVAAPDGRVLLSAAGDARLATAGTGDVLSGIIAGLLAAGVPPFQAAALGAYVHGCAASLGPRVGLVAGDIPDLVPRVLGMTRRPVWAEVDLGAIRANAAWLRDRCRPAELCAVVKAFGYGHGPVRVAEAAIAGGATWLAVATVEEGVQLRQAGITEPVLLLSEPVAGAMADVIAWKLTPTLYTEAGVDGAARAVAGYGDGPRLAVHVKVDTGMHRVGADASSALEIAAQVADAPGLELEGLCTHFAVADEPGDPYTLLQAERFRAVLDKLAAQGIRARMLHAANSAGAIAFPGLRFDLVRCGIALYGLAPSPEMAAMCHGLRPAMSVKARVSFVKRVPAGDRISYGLRYRVKQDATIATVPIGYADGVPRRLSASGGQVLIGGARRPLAGSVTMDQLMVDCGDDGVCVGDEVVLLGSQGGQEITAWEWADRLGTIAYEVVCGISARVPRDYRTSVAD